MHCTDFSERCQTSFVISCLSNTTSLLIRVMWFCFLLLGFIFFLDGGGGGCFVVGGRICFFVFLGGMRVFLSILLSLRVMVGGGCDFCGF